MAAGAGGGGSGGAAGELAQYLAERRRNWPGRRRAAAGVGGREGAEAAAEAEQRARRLAEVLARQRSLGVARAAGTEGLAAGASGGRARRDRM